MTYSTSTTSMTYPFWTREKPTTSITQNTSMLPTLTGRKILKNLECSLAYAVSKLWLTENKPFTMLHSITITLIFFRAHFSAIHSATRIKHDYHIHAG